MFKKIESILFNKIDAAGLSVFRMFYSVILFCEVLQLYRFRHIIYDKIPFVFVGEIDVSFIFSFWIIIISLLFLGLFTRTAVIINYLFSVIIFSSATVYSYHVFYAYVGINFLLIFMPLSRVLSLDSLIEKIKYNNVGSFWEPDRNVLAANYITPVFVGIALVYFDSVFYKFTSHMWLSGLGMWLPANLPMGTWSDVSTPLMNTEWLAKFFGYLVLVFETVFIFLFWFKRLRVPFMLLGVFFHLGILLEFPIPWFALTAVALYVLMIPVGWWRKIGKWIKLKHPIYKLYYDSECPLCIKTVVIIKHFDVFNTTECITVQENFQNEKALEAIAEETLLINIHGVDKKGNVYVGYYAYVALLRNMIYTFPIGILFGLPLISAVGKKIYAFVAGNRITERCTTATCPMPIIQKPFPETQNYLINGWNRLSITKTFYKTLFLFFVIVQVVITWFSPLAQNAIEAMGIKETINKIAYIPYTKLYVPLKNFLGVTHHPVFMDGHFKKYNHIIKVAYLDNYQREYHVPITQENGMTDSYAQGALWVGYQFRILSPTLSKPRFEKGVVPFLSLYAHQRPEKSKTGKYIFYVKEIDIPSRWEKDFLKRQIAKPWKKAGEYLNGQFFWTEEMEQIFKNELGNKKQDKQK